ncbi:amidohydrolase [Aspergillus saccharolyticus JOP 1030-1]|uniref:Amidohydrolase n=1 Tax=Aspergillus saccharolyticus JOP 1030-1 TaxID=1450539 RepID=A0A318ZBK3_9EURO|nr:amidohydrolase [Aspergillus saccharolyticus JOP 1030-1]PYH40850.1 amidohydrolase [Aspergillus saccharolyticus JOP 1030-1]
MQYSSQDDGCMNADREGFLINRRRTSSHVIIIWRRHARNIFGILITSLLSIQQHQSRTTAEYTPVVALHEDTTCVTMATKGGLLGFAGPAAPKPARPPRRRFLRRWRRSIGGWAVIATLLLLSRWSPADVLTPTTSAATKREFYGGLQKCHDGYDHSPHEAAVSARRQNPRWNPVSGQKAAIIIQNATLFDGELTLRDRVDVVFDAGVIRSVLPTALHSPFPVNAQVIDVQGAFVTPGLVDMHSHHLLLSFPQLPATKDVNESPLLGPLTSFVRGVDGFNPDDPAIRIIASGGVTSSLIPPGSANVIGGEAYLVKNLPRPGPDSEPVIEELLLDHGIPDAQRQRYLKMACGENPRRFYGHTRLGLAWLLREELNKARELHEQQSEWCSAAFRIEKTRFGQSQQIATFVQQHGKRPEEFKLDTLVALLRGELNLNVHCYTPDDLERMLAVLHEFDIHPRAFHHALSAWQVPEFLKHLEENITIATFADNGLYKAEAYESNLRGPKILDDHGLRVALKSDHTGEGNYAKYLLDQAATAHSFGLSEAKALQAVTSIPARSIQQDHRIGYTRPGYDADLVIWDDHPLQVGATPIEVFIDGRAVLKPNGLPEIPNQGYPRHAPAVRPSVIGDEGEHICNQVRDKSRAQILFTGIQQVLLPATGYSTPNHEETSILFENGQITCLDSKSACLAHASHETLTQITLQNGYITPGLVAFGNKLGIEDIASEPSTGDGKDVKGATDPLNERKSVSFAKYGVHLHGRAFSRAQVGGVTKAVTPPLSAGIVQGVSVGVRTHEHASILDGGLWKDEVALHFTVGQGARNDDTPTVSSGIERLRQVLEQGEKESAGVYARAANGSLPVVVHAFHQDDIAQLVRIKQDFRAVNLVLYGGHGAPLVARHLAEESIPVILTGNRGAPDHWEKKDIPVGPPLTDSAAKTLLDAGVQLGLAIVGDSGVHALAQHARAAGKQAGLTEREAIALVSTNIEEILGLQKGTEREHYVGDFVVWEGNPLAGEGSVVVSVLEGGEVADCWPDRVGAVL